MGERRKIYDQDYRYLGYTKDRDLPLEEHEYIRVVGAFVVSKGRLLVTKRAQTKSYGGQWEITMGSLVEDERPVMGSLRELEEEVGIVAKEEDMAYLGSRREDQKFSEIYLLEQEVERIILQEEEVQDYRFITREELDQMLRDHDFALPMEERILAYYDIIASKLE